MAAPLVSGVAALWLSSNTSLVASDLAAVLLENSTTPGVLKVRGAAPHGCAHCSKEVKIGEGKRARLRESIVRVLIGVVVLLCAWECGLGNQGSFPAWRRQKRP